MKKILTIIFLSSLILTGCSQQQGLSEAELFDKKKECTNYREKVESKEDKQLYGDESGEYGYKIESIFYSPIKNSCLYGVVSTFMEKGKPNIRYWFLIKDVFSGELVESSGMIPPGMNEKYFAEEQRFYKQMEELKGE